MSVLDQITVERQRLAERLERVDAERSKLFEQLAELEAAERVLGRFGQPSSAARRRGRPPRVDKTQPAAARGKRQSRRRRDGSAPKPALPLGDAILHAVEASRSGISAQEIGGYLSREFGMMVRPNHLGMALQRHRRAGRLEERDARWFAQSPTGGTTGTV